MKLKVLYFAALRDRAGCDGETVSTNAASMTDLYVQLQQSRNLRYTSEQLRVSCNGEFVAWDTQPNEGDEVVFIPPVSGG